MLALEPFTSDTHATGSLHLTIQIVRVVKPLFTSITAFVVEKHVYKTYTAIKFVPRKL